MAKDTIITRLKDAWNVFSGRESIRSYHNYGPGFGSSFRPDRVRLSRGTERSIVTSIYNRIAMDAAAIEIKHIKTDKDGRYKEEIDSGLNNCLTLEANIDQAARAFRQDIYLSLLDEGSVAIVPTNTERNPDTGDDIDIYTMRTGKIVDWYPEKVKVEIYNDRNGRREEVICPKTSIAIVENPLYAVVNEPNSVLQRLIRKLNLLDAIDEQSASGKLDLIIQLPYVVKTDTKRNQAEKRRKDIEDQLTGSKYGIAYIDGTERITQLNRAVENNLMKQIEYLTSMLYSQLGINQEILDGSAKEETMLNYQNRLIEPIVSAVVDEMKRKFLSRDARSNHESIMSFRDPLKLVPTSQLAELADKLTRNEIATSNEIRQSIGMKPAKDPAADELRNKNLNQPTDVVSAKTEQNKVNDGKKEENSE